MNFDTLLQTLKNAQDSNKAKAMCAYMKNQFEYLGIQSPVRKNLCKPFFNEAKKHPSVDWDFVEKCWQSPFREMQYVALDYLTQKRKFLSLSDVSKLKNLAERKSWWDTIDQLDRIIGNIALHFPELNETLLQWSLHPNKWIRRIAIDHQLLRKTQTNTDLLEKIIVNNFGQTEFFINKAIGWALRDYSKTNPVWVRAFLEKYQHEMASLSIREARKYI